jgi:peptidyl-prolyl cis-trans isomerase SurA
MIFPRKSLLASVVMFASFWASGLPGASVSWAAPVVIDRLEAAVNSQLVLLSDVEQFRKTLKLRSQLDPIFAGTSIAQKGASASTEEIVNFLIDEKLIAQAFPVTDTEVEQEINSIQSNNRIDRSQLKAALAEQGFTFDEYFELIRVSASKRNLIDRDIRTKVSISDEDVKNYFLTHYTPSETGNRSYTLRLIYISPRTYKTPEATYDAAKGALKAVQAGESFDEVAKRVSDDATASSGGDLGTLKEDQMSPAIRDQIKGLKVGDVSPIFGDAKRGFYIVKLIDVKTGESDRLQKVRDEIRNQLTASEYQHQIQLWLQRQRQTAYIRQVAGPS